MRLLVKHSWYGVISLPVGYNPRDNSYTKIYYLSRMADCSCSSRVFYRYLISCDFWYVVSRRAVVDFAKVVVAQKFVDLGRSFSCEDTHPSDQKIENHNSVFELLIVFCAVVLSLLQYRLSFLLDRTHPLPVHVPSYVCTLSFFRPSRIILTVK